MRQRHPDFTFDTGCFIYVFKSMDNGYGFFGDDFTPPSRFFAKIEP
jgi:hypothetical protein